jgi:hypothetical protein
VKVKYLDSLDLNGIEISQEGTRVSVWTNAMVRKAIKEDTKPDGTFGAASVRIASFSPFSFNLFLCNYRPSIPPKCFSYLLSNS